MCRGSFVSLDSLSETEASELFFEKWLPQANRQLKGEQEGLVKSKLKIESCRQPLYLKILFEEAKLWRSYGRNETISRLAAAVRFRPIYDAGHGNNQLPNP